MKQPDKETISQLEELPNVGKAIAKDLRLIGIDSPKELIGRDAFELYEKLCTLTGKRHDPCVIDVFISVIRFMEEGETHPWWYFTDERKKRAARTEEKK